MRGVIRLGDLTSHGGKVITANSRSTVHGSKVARKGDACTCPIKGHSNCFIAEGDAAFVLDGIPVAFHGHKTSCGATLISSMPTSGRE